MFWGRCTTNERRGDEKSVILEDERESKLSEHQDPEQDQKTRTLRCFDEQKMWRIPWILWVTMTN